MPTKYFSLTDFVLDRGAYELRRGGLCVQLERIPLELLFLLVDRRGQLVTREEILERVWGKGVFVDSENSINTAVRKVRRALCDDPDAPRFVATVPARGYRFVAEIRAPKTSRAEQFRARPPSAMVGRERELASLLSGLDDAASRRGRLFLISGEPGVGKTRLADEVAAAADAKRMAILVGHCSEHDEAVAYLPFVEILENFVDRASNPDSLRTALGRPGAGVGALDAQTQEHPAGTSATARFAAGSGAAPFVQLLFRLRCSNRFRTTDADDSRRSSLGRRFDVVAARSPDAAAFRFASDGDRHLPRR